LHLVKNEPIAGNNDEEPEEQAGESMQRSDEELDNRILALRGHIVRQLWEESPYYDLTDNEDAQEDHGTNEQSTDDR
jgi:hypothetical protein